MTRFPREIASILLTYVYGERCNLNPEKIKCKKFMESYRKEKEKGEKEEIKETKVEEIDETLYKIDKESGKIVGLTAESYDRWEESEMLGYQLRVRASPLAFRLRGIARSSKYSKEITESFAKLYRERCLGWTVCRNVTVSINI